MIARGKPWVSWPYISPVRNIFRLNRVLLDFAMDLPIVSKPSEEHQDYWIKPGMDFGYHISTVAT